MSRATIYRKVRDNGITLPDPRGTGGKSVMTDRLALWLRAVLTALGAPRWERMRGAAAAA